MIEAVSSKYHTLHKIDHWTKITRRHVTRCGWLVPRGRVPQKCYSLFVVRGYAVDHGLNLCRKCFGREESLRVDVKRGLLKIDRHYLGPCYFPNLDYESEGPEPEWKPNLPQFLETYKVCSTARTYMQRVGEQNVQRAVEQLVVSLAARQRAGLKGGVTLVLRRGKYQIEIREV